MSCQRFERTCCLCDHGRTDMTVKGADFSETSVDFYQTTLRPIVTKHNSINVYQLGYAVTQLTKQLRKEPEGRGFDPIWGIWNIPLVQSFQPHYDCGVDLPFNRNEYQGYLLRGKGGRCLGMTTLPPSCDDCLVEILGASTCWTLRASLGLTGRVLPLPCFHHGNAIISLVSDFVWKCDSGPVFGIKPKSCTCLFFVINYDITLFVEAYSQHYYLYLIKII